MLKKILLPVFALFLFTGCTAPSNEIILNPIIAPANQDPTLMGQTVSIGANDARQDKALAKLNRDGKLVVLMPSRDPAYLMQEVVDKQMSDRGYMIGNNANTAIQVTINELFADVQEGNLRHSINTVIDIAVFVDTKNGSTFTKNYRTTHAIDGAFTASNNNVANAINQTLTEVIAVMAKDTGISDYIKQNSN